MSVPTSAALQVSAPHFTGTLGELSQALRAGTVRPDEVPLLDITRQLLARLDTLHEDDRLEALPLLASVIALKARLLLPQPEPEVSEWADDMPADDLIQGVQALAELDELTQFLARRRAARSGMLAARPLALDLPRKQRAAAGKLGLEKLLKAAQSAVREVAPPLLARERLSLADALHALRAYAQRLGRFTLLGVPVQSWGQRSTYFAALLEGIKEGDFSAQQEANFADIEIISLRSE